MTFERPITFMNKIDSLSLPTVYYIKESKTLFPSDKLKYSIINSKGKKLNRVKIVDGNFNISDKKGTQLVEFNLNSIKERYNLPIHFKKSNSKKSIKIRQGRLWEGGSVYGIEFFNEKTQEIDYISILLNIQSYEVQDFTIFDHNFDWNAFEDYDISGFKDLCDSNVIGMASKTDNSLLEYKIRIRQNVDTTFIAIVFMYILHHAILDYMQMISEED